MFWFALHSPLSAWKKGDRPISPFVQLSLGHYSQDGPHILLGSQLGDDKEIDTLVERVKAELDEFAGAAKKELRVLQGKLKS